LNQLLNLFRIKGGFIMKCQFEKELNEGKIVCDAEYINCNIPQCPTNIFNKCQEDANSEALKESQNKPK